MITRQEFYELYQQGAIRMLCYVENLFSYLAEAESRVEERQQCITLRACGESGGGWAKRVEGLKGQLPEAADAQLSTHPSRPGVANGVGAARARAREAVVGYFR